jgi:hypothetical protein
MMKMGMFHVDNIESTNELFSSFRAILCPLPKLNVSCNFDWVRKGLCYGGKVPKYYLPGPGFIPSGNEFLDWVKKSPRPSTHLSTG